MVDFSPGKFFRGHGVASNDYYWEVVSIRDAQHIVIQAYDAKTDVKYGVSFLWPIGKDFENFIPDWVHRRKFQADLEALLNEEV